MRWQKITILLAMVFLVALTGGKAFAQTGDGFDLSWNVIGGGGAGGPLTGSGFSVRSTIVQTAIGSSSYDIWETRHGYWPGSINTVPQFFGLPDVYIDHTTSLPVIIDLWLYATDKESTDGSMTYTIEGSPPAGAGLSIVNNRWLIINPSPTWCPLTTATIRVTDPGGLWDQDSLRIGVTWSCLG
jgi:hypothetical protein